MPVKLYASGVASPACWDSPPFAFNFKMAAEHFEPLPLIDCFLKDSHFINKSRLQLGEATRATVRKLSRPTRVDFGAGDACWMSVQKEFATLFKQALLPQGLESLLASRFTKHFAALCVDGLTPYWNELLSCFRNAQSHFAMAALKTLLNS